MGMHVFSWSKGLELSKMVRICRKAPGNDIAQRTILLTGGYFFSVLKYLPSTTEISEFTLDFSYALLIFYEAATYKNICCLLQFHI